MEATPNTGYWQIPATPAPTPEPNTPTLAPPPPPPALAPTKRKGLWIAAGVAAVIVPIAAVLIGIGIGSNSTTDAATAGPAPAPTKPIPATTLPKATGLAGWAVEHSTEISNVTDQLSTYIDAMVNGGSTGLADRCYDASRYATDMLSGDAAMDPNAPSEYVSMLRHYATGFLYCSLDDYTSASTEIEAGTEQVTLFNAKLQSLL